MWQHGIWSLRRYNKRGMKTTLEYEEGTLIINGVVYAQTRLVEANPSSLTMFLYRLNNQGTAAANNNFKIYAFSGYDNDELSVNLVPCLDADGVACFYDTVNKQTCYNKSAGNFNYGI